MTWKQVAEQQIENISGMPVESQVELLRNALVSIADNFDRSEEFMVSRLQQFTETIPITFRQAANVDINTRQRVGAIRMIQLSSFLRFWIPRLRSKLRSDRIERRIASGDSL